jgi:transcriptional regulator with XRE-family HTH domain
MPTEPGPATRRRQLGRQLRGLRLAAGLRSIAAAAEASGLSTATISRIENAKQTILPRTVPLLRGLGAPLLDHLLRLAEESEDRGWLVAYSDTTPNWFERYLGEEAEASEIWKYEAEYMTGLLQTPDYCRAVRAANSDDVTEERRCCTDFVEVDSGGLYPDRPADYERRTWMFGQLRGLALSPAKSMALVSRVLEEL